MFGQLVCKTLLAGALAFLLVQLCLPTQALGQTPVLPKLTGIRATAWKCLRDRVNHRGADHRIQAVYALGTLGVQSDTIRLIESMLQDKDGLVRQAAAQTLGDMQASQAIPELRLALDDKSAGVSFSAAQTLWRMGDQRGASILAQVLAGDRGVSPGLIRSEWS